MVELGDPGRIGLTLDDLTDDHDWSVVHPPAITQQLGRAALNQGVEGLLVPAASLVDSNLVILVDNLLPTSEMNIVDWIDPKLYVDRS